MDDAGHKETDDVLANLEVRVRREYETAYKEIEKKAREYLDTFSAEDKLMLKRLQNDDITSVEYYKWRSDRMIIGKRYEALLDVLSRDFVNSDQIAMAMVDDTLPEVFAINANFGTYMVEHATRIDTSYSMYTPDTITHLLRDNPDLLPRIKDGVDIPKDIRWHREKMNSALTQGILQGDAIPKIAKRLRSVTDMDIKASIRNARTMVTGAENAGRQHSFERAEGMGIKMKKIWISTLDKRTRSSHVVMDNEVVPIRKKFSNGLRHPGDASCGKPEEVYNCRCTMGAAIEGTSLEEGINGMQRFSRLGSMSYDSWKAMHMERLKAMAHRGGG